MTLDRRSLRSRLRLAAFTTLTGAGLAASVAVAGQPADANAKPVRTRILMLEVQDVNAILVDPKDAALKRAIGQLSPRLRDLPDEIPGARTEGAPFPEVIDFLTHILGRHTRMALEYDMNNQDEDNRFGAGLQLSWAMKDEAEAKVVNGLVMKILDAVPEQIEVEVLKDGPFAGMQQSLTPAGHIRWGPRTADGSWYQLNFGRPGDPAKIFPPMKPFKPVMGGMVTPFAQGSLDLSPLTPLVNMLAAGAGAGNPVVGDVVRQLVETGLIGADAKFTEMFAGHSDTESVTLTIYRGSGKFMKANGQTKEALTDADFKIIPADATAVGLSRFDPSAAIETFRKMTTDQEPVAEMFAQIRKATEVDVIEDILAQIGGVAGTYMSDSTGGGTLGSGVLVLQLKDAARFRGALDKFAGRLNGLLADKNTARGYVALRQWTMDGANFTSLQFPGLPVPLEVTYGFAGSYFVAAFNPQGALVAARQIMGKGDGGLMSNPDIAALFPKGKSFTSIGYMDTARNLRTGYGILSLVGSALQNVIRSPKGVNADREVGLIVPPYNELAKNVRPASVFTYWDGEDLISEAHGDRSMVVNAGAACGVIYNFAPVALAVGGVAAMGDAFDKARMRAIEARDHVAEPVPAPANPGRPNFRFISEPGAEVTPQNPPAPHRIPMLPAPEDPC